MKKVVQGAESNIPRPWGRAQLNGVSKRGESSPLVVGSALSRRRFLKLAATAAAGVPIVSQLGCAPAVIDAPDLGTDLSLGYTSGEVTSDSAIVWLRAAPGSRVVVQYGKDPALAKFDSTPEFGVREQADFTAQTTLRALDSSSTYYFRAQVTGRRPGPIARFKTAPHPDAAAKVSFCFSGDTRETYKPFSVMDAVRAQQPDFFLHLGDTIYADRAGAAHTLPEFWAKYRGNRDDAAMQRCFHEMSFYLVWDDHEVANDYLPGHPLAPIGRQAFLDYWPIRQFAGEPHRIYRSFRWGQAMELFLLDTRQHRDPAKGTMLGRRQKEWLFSNLAAAKSLFKFVGTSVPMSGGGSDRWDGYPKERSELLNFIKDQKITGVVFLSADLHHAAITKIPNGHGLRDITAGPLAAPLNRVTNSANSRYEYYLALNFNFAKITVDPTDMQPHALIEFIDQDNHIFHRTQIRA